MVNPTPIVMAVIGIGQFLYPFAKRSWTLLGKSRAWTEHHSTIEELTSTCSTVHSDVLHGCADMKLHGRVIYATCMAEGSRGKHRRWYSPQSALRDEFIGKPKDELIAWDLDTDKVTIIELKDFPNVSDRTFHGLDVVEVTPHHLSIYVINHLPHASTISKFSHQPHTSTASHIKTFSNSSLVPNPHSVFALPDEDNNNAFYVTSDHTERTGWRRAVATFLQRPHGQVIYHSDTAGWKQVTTFISGAGAITGLKTGISKRLFVSEILGGNVNVFDRKVTGGDLSVADASRAEGNLTWVQRISLDFMPSGLALQGTQGDDLYVAGLPKPLEFLAHQGEGLLLPGVSDHAADKHSAASLLARIDTRQLGSKFFGGGGADAKKAEGDEGSATEYTSDPVVEELIVDEFGKLVNASYAVVVDRARAGRKGDLFVSGLSGKGVLRCKHFAL
ncbi:MAG: Serum paraoxonase/arylesterase 2 [Piccolia ochrophora]|nr:MAG: Serum paraoxonase/arylesterase 2 [Piccolia ochrophora]